MDPIKLKTKATLDSIDAVLASARELRRESDALEKRISSLLSGYSLDVTTSVESSFPEDESCSVESKSHEKLKVRPKLMAKNSRNVRQTSSCCKPSKSSVGTFSVKTTESVSMADAQRRDSIRRSKADKLVQKTRWRVSSLAAAFLERSRLRRTTEFFVQSWRSVKLPV